MKEVTSPIIAIVLTLCAVFVPIAFLGGLTGELYRQFAVTISIAVVISGIVALTLTPSLCVLILKREHRQPGRFFRWFNDWFAPRHRPLRGRRGLDAAPRRASRSLLFAGMVALTVGLWRITPGSLVPDEDQGYYIAAVFLPDGATLERTDKVVNEVRQHHQVEPGQRERRGLHRLRLPRRRLPQQRRDHLRHAEALGRAQGLDRAAGRRVLHEDRRTSRKALVLAFGPPPIFGLGNAGGFEFYIQNRGEGGAPAPVRGDAAAPRRASHKDPMFGQVNTLWRANVPQLYVETTARRRRRWACRSTSSTTRSPRRSARSTSTTSTSTAAPGRC